MSSHEGQHVIRGGPAPENARAALLLIHGRGATADDIYSLGEEIADGIPGVTLLAPQASGNAWYPQRFLAPLAENEPLLSSALGIVDGLVSALGAAGIGPEKVVLAGFSQGACVSIEYALRHARRYGGIVGLRGALIGPPGTPRAPQGSLSGTPVYLGCSDRDAHIPLASVEESARVLERAGASVAKTIFPGMGHTVNAAEIAAAREILRAVSGGV